MVKRSDRWGFLRCESQLTMAAGKPAIQQNTQMLWKLFVVMMRLTKPLCWLNARPAKKKPFQFPSVPMQLPKKLFLSPIYKPPPPLLLRQPLLSRHGGLSGPQYSRQLRQSRHTKMQYFQSYSGSSNSAFDRDALKRAPQLERYAL
jgi:hypothetical protein